MTEPIIPPRTYFVVYAILIVLTFLTVGVSYAHIGAWHTIVAVIIATTKGLLVVAFFMGLLYSHKLNWLVVAASLFWLGILLVMTLIDYTTRNWQIY